MVCGLAVIFNGREASCVEFGKRSRLQGVKIRETDTGPTPFCVGGWSSSKMDYVLAAEWVVRGPDSSDRGEWRKELKFGAWHNSLAIHVFSERSHWTTTL